MASKYAVWFLKKVKGNSLKLWAEIISNTDALCKVYFDHRADEYSGKSGN